MVRQTEVKTVSQCENDKKKKMFGKKWFVRRSSSKKLNDVRDDPVANGNAYRSHEASSPTRSMPKEIRCNSPSDQSQVSNISGTTELENNAPKIYPSKSLATGNPNNDPYLPKNLFHIDPHDSSTDEENEIQDPPANKKINFLLPDITSDSEEDSLFQKSVQSTPPAKTTERLQNGTLQSETKRRQPETPIHELLQKMADDAFKYIDREETGTLKQSEFFYGVLIVQAKFSEYFGPVVCRSVQRSRADKIFQKMQGPMNGYICKERFADAVVFLFTEIMVESAKYLFRVILIASVVSPFVLALARFIIQIISGVFFFFFPFDPTPFIATALQFIIPPPIYNTATLSWTSCLLTFVFVPFFLRQTEFSNISMEQLKKSLNMEQLQKLFNTKQLDRLQKQIERKLTEISDKILDSQTSQKKDKNTF